MKNTLHLKNLNLQNFATFKDQEIKFQSSFNAIIGETGSGKSLILDALELVMGSRADKKLIRKDCDFSTVEATFFCADQEIKTFFDKEGFPFEGEEIIIKRILYKAGTSKVFINFQAANLQILTSFSRRFIDLVGQFENQKLLSDTYQLILLDNFGSLEKERKNYTQSFEALKVLKEEKEKLLNEQKTTHERIDYINYQLNDLNKLNPSVEDEISLQKKKFNITNSEKRKELNTKIQNLITGDSEFDGAQNLLRKLDYLLKDNEILFKEINTAPISEFSDYLNEILDIISKEEIEIKEEDIDLFIEKLDLYQKLKRRFNAETEDLVKIKDEFELELKKLNNFKADFDDISKKIIKQEASCFELAKNLHQKRIDASLKLSKELTKSIQELRMAGATISIRVEKINELNYHGISSVSFYAETNPGEGFYKIKEIASGGELSRILLSLRQILSSKDSISIFLFDEIDTGVGGETALLIGKSLQKVSLNSQVIAITHLPQIAKFASSLVKVEKEIFNDKEGNRTYSSIKIIEGSGTEEEIRLMTPLQ